MDQHISGDQTATKDSKASSDGIKGGAQGILRRAQERHRAQARRDWNRPHHLDVKTSSPAALSARVMANCNRCGSSLAGRREKVTDAVTVYLCRCGTRRRVSR